MSFVVMFLAVTYLAEIAGPFPVAATISAAHIPHSLGRQFASTAARGAPHTPERHGDRKLLTRVARGEVGALRVLYDHHARRAMAIAMRVLRNESEAEDVVQETFLEVWRRAAQFDNQRGGVAAWVVTIARSRAIDRLRSTGTTSRAIEAASGTLEPPPEALPSDEVERRRDEARVAAALGELPIEQRQTIELAYFEGLSQSEIAQRTGSPLGTVKMRVKLAMSKLAKLLKPETDEG
jgi:RNA polymerase sigma-70 factor (ECF subfamily)